MKILLDECLPIDFRHSFPHHDQGIHHQQRSTGRRISMILIRSRTNQLEDPLPLTDAILHALETISPGQTSEVPPTF